MHYTGTIWRPPYEADSLLLEVTAGCTHHKCKFCTLYKDLPFPFRISPLADIEEDLTEVQMLLHTPIAKLGDKLFRRPARTIRRVYLVGANPFVLAFPRLKAIAELIHQYLPTCESIGGFSRVTDVTLKTDAELQELRALGYTGLTIGVETGDDIALAFMRKGYVAQAIVDQTHRLDATNIAYNFFYLTGISGAGRGQEGALASAAVFNQTHPQIIGSSMLTVFPESELYQEIQDGNWAEESELEKLKEVRTLIAHLTIPVRFATLGASNAVWVDGHLPADRERLLDELGQVCAPRNEDALRLYRTTLPHL